MIIPYKVGFIGMGNLAQSILKRLVESKVVSHEKIYASNRTPGKLTKVKDLYNVNICQNNEEVVDAADIVIIAVKPQDFITAIEPISSSFSSHHIVISLAAGLQIDQIKKLVADGRIVRAMPNTPSVIGKGVVGYCTEQDDNVLETVVEDLFEPLGFVTKMNEDDQFEALMISCSAGTGFVFELMMYWQDWIEERGIAPEIAKEMTVETFLGAAMLAAHNHTNTIEELQSKVTSKKGVTEAGLESMRELEIERALRYSFEKAALRNQALAKQK